MVVVGRATVTITADTRAFAREAERQIRRALNKIDTRGATRDINRRMNEDLSRGLGSRIGDTLRAAFGRVNTRTVTRRVVQNVNRDMDRGFFRGGRFAARRFVENFGVVLQGGISRAAAGVIGTVAIPLMIGLLTTGGTVAAGSFVAAFGAGIAGLGIFAAAQAEEVQQAFEDMAQSVAEDMARIAEPLEASLIDIAGIARDTFETFLDPLEQAFADLAAGPLTQFATDLGSAFEALAPTIAPVTDAFIQIMEELGPELANEVFPAIAEAIIGLSNTIGENAELFADLLGAFLRLPAHVLNFLESLTRLTAWFAESPQRIQNALFGIAAALALIPIPAAQIVAVFAAIAGVAITNADEIGAAWNRLQNAFAPVLAALDPIISRFQEFGTFLLNTFSPVLSTLFNQITGSLIPGFGQLLVSATPTIDKFLDFGQRILTTLVPALGQIVSLIIGAIVPTMARLGEILAPVIDQLIGLAESVLAVVVPALRQIATRIVNELVPAFLDFLEEIQPIVSFLIDVLGPVVVSVFKAIVRIISGALDIVIGVLKTFTALLRGDWQGAWDGIKQILRGALDVIIGLIQVSIVGRAVRLVRAGLGAIAGIFRSIGSNIASGARSLWSSVVGFFRSGLSSIVSAVRGGLSDVGGLFSRLPGQILGAVSGFGSMLFSAGVRLVQGLINGIVAKFNDLRATASRLAGQVADFWPFSPAKEGPLRLHPPEEWGQNVTSLIAEGLRRGGSEIMAAARQNAALAETAASSIGASAGNAAQPANQIAPNVGVSVFIGERELTDIVDVQIDERDINLNRASLRATGTV